MKPGNFLSFSNDLDPAVAATLGAGERRRADQQLSKPERKSKAKERKKAADRRGRRALYDLPPELIDAVQQLAEPESGDYVTTASQIAALALTRLINQVADGEISIREFLSPVASSPRYSHTVDLPVLRKP